MFPRKPETVWIDEVYFFKGVVPLEVLNIGVLVAAELTFYLPCHFIGPYLNNTSAGIWEVSISFQKESLSLIYDSNKKTWEHCLFYKGVPTNYGHIHPDKLTLSQLISYIVRLSFD